MRLLILVGMILSLLSVVDSSLAADQTTSLPSEQDLALNSKDYRIGTEDKLDIAVWNNEALSRTVPVRPDGKISLPLLHDVQAAGLTPTELREVLVEKLAEYLPAPEVSVIVSEVHSYKVSVIGEVKEPGRYDITGRTTVLDILAQAKGTTEFAARSRIFVLRPNGTSMQRIPFNYNKVITADGGEEILYLKPRDIVVVP